MISIIVCSRKNPSWNFHQRNIAKTIGTPFEYLRIDNRNNTYNLCSAYNAGVRNASGNILVFMHEDVFFMEENWGKVLESKFNDPATGLVGVAGTQYIFPDNPAWVLAGRPFIRGHVIHELNNGSVYNLTVFNQDRSDSEVVAVDGLFFAIRKSLFEKIQFDEITFDGFHFYDLDICMQIRKTHRLIVTWDILVKHLSGGSFDASWKKYASHFLTKYKDILPASCTQNTPDLSKRIPFENFDLLGRVPQVTIT
ncbi:MAG TPA: glycosyltransferase [Chitinispirillaceae bacterium]|nr:glycosyltransferase [Chitinispirillaceae bacterium]